MTGPKLPVESGLVRGSQAAAAYRYVTDGYKFDRFCEEGRQAAEDQEINETNRSPDPLISCDY